MAFQFKRDRNENLTLTLAGDIDLEVTPDIKSQLSSQLADAASLTIDAASVSYLDSSGVSILVIAMQSCKQKQINLAVSKVSEEAMRVLQLAKLDKILPIGEITGPAHLVDVDVFSDVGTQDSQIAEQVNTADAPHSDDDLIAALSSGDMTGDTGAPAPPAEITMTPEPEAAPQADAQPDPAPQQSQEPTQQPAPPDPAPQQSQEAAQQPAADPADPTPSNSDGGDGGGGSFTPGTFG